MVMYMEEEETRYLLPLKEYIAYCDSLRLECRHILYYIIDQKYLFLHELTPSDRVKCYMYVTHAATPYVVHVHVGTLC